ncbi:siderophore ABC transporter substrate-binding protein [Pseudomonadota bacterium AL_CKDN230030165-1A_HGKHYDSX7]
MIRPDRPGRWMLPLLLGAALALQGCDRASTTSAQATPAAADAAAPPSSPITVEHALGTTVIAKRPQRVAALDMNEVDFLDQLGVPVAGMPKDFVPDFLANYKDDPGVLDLGAIVQPNLERVHAARPDLILITSLQANQYKALTEIAPTLHFDVDYRDSQSNHIELIKHHLSTLGDIFGKQETARAKIAELDAQVAAARGVIGGRPERALVIIHNNGAFSAFGEHSRYGFIFGALGVKPANPGAQSGLHGHPVSSEFIQQTNPDVIYLVDRTAVMERRPVLTAESIANPLLRQTNAWKNGRVVFADPYAWYVTAASPASIKRVIDDVLKGYAP